MECNGLVQSRKNAIQKLLASIAKSENILDSFFEIKSACEKGEGYVGEKNFVTIRGSNSKTVKLFVKASPTNQIFKEAFDPRIVFLIEINFYDTVYPAFTKFQNERKVLNPFQSVVSCLQTSTELNHEILVLENIGELGYRLFDRTKQMDQMYAEFIMNEYGRFHAVSLAIKDQQPKEYQRLVNSLDHCDLLKLMLDFLGDGIYILTEKGQALFHTDKEASVLEAYKVFSDKLIEHFKAVYLTIDQYSVILHGDCWSNNLMFKYSNTDENKPIEMCLLDFQLTRDGSPVLDLSSILYSACSKTVYNNYEHYLKVYHDSLSKSLRAMGSDPDKVFPFEELLKQWRFFSKYGFIMAHIFYKVMFMHKDDATDITESLENGEHIFNGFVKENRNDHLYYARLKDLINHYYDKKLM